ncbi:MAG: hypothetical protein KDK04_19730 [Candidatus Competibacteraceae bacterium]|nr:hypothetical protein [Candidatus Competibacteraceae bacterium]
MPPLALGSLPRAILHIDADAFFASCEQANNPSLRGKPVVTGKERGIASAVSYEAKALGIKRGMRIREIKKICPDAIHLPSDYETYSLYSQRVFAIVRRYTDRVEEYSIDECFAELTGLIVSTASTRCSSVPASLRLTNPSITASGPNCHNTASAPSTVKPNVSVLGCRCWAR